MNSNGQKMGLVAGKHVHTRETPTHVPQGYRVQVGTFIYLFIFGWGNGGKRIMHRSASRRLEVGTNVIPLQREKLAP